MDSLTESPTKLPTGLGCPVHPSDAIITAMQLASDNDFSDHSTMNIREPKVTAGVAIGQAVVVQSQ